MEKVQENSTTSSATNSVADEISAILRNEAKELEKRAIFGENEDTDKELDAPAKRKLFGSSKKKIEKPAMKQVSYFALFRFATTLDKFMITVGIFGSAAVGATIPVMTVLFTKVLGTFITYNFLVLEGKKDTGDSLLKKEVNGTALTFLYISIGTYIVSYVTYLCWNVTATKQAKKMREAYYKSIMSQEAGWFDSVDVGALTTRMTSDISTIKNGIDEKTGVVVQHTTTFLGGFVLAFVKGWRMALVVLSVMPLMIGSAAIMGMNVSKWTNKVQESFAETGAVATEVLSSMRTVMAFNSQKKEIDRYSSKLDKGYKAGMRRTMVLGLGLGATFFFIYILYSLGFWYGAKLIRNNTSTLSEVLNVFFALVMGGFILGGAAPSISAISSARGAAPDVFDVIDKKSKIDATDLESGDSAEDIKGEIEFRNVTFNYPTRGEVKVLNNVSIKVKPGQKVAFVGESGCGKSTTIALVQRLYDCLEGNVLIDGKDIREYNVRSLRQNMGLVSQEPVLFGVSIAQNIKWGAKDYENNPPTQEDVEEACKGANIHDFIMTLPEKYETLVGERGALLSGGQKQRIAIARALIRNPKILLLDEATSALDTESEKLVQDALDKSTVNRTTITIAHRLSTIKSSDMIYVFGKGQVIESGTHAELVAMDGAYASLVKAQDLRKKDDILSESKIDHQNEKDELEEKLIGANKSMSQIQRLSEEETTKDQSSNKKGSYTDLLWVLRKYSSQVRLFIPGVLVSMIDGCILPSFSLIFSRIVIAFGEPDPKKQKKDTDFYAFVFLMFAVGNFATLALRTYLFGRGAVRLNDKLKSDMFTSIVYQDSEFFDKPTNGSGALTLRLASEPDDIYKACADAFPLIFSCLGSVITALTIGFTRSWMISLVVLAVFPALAFTQAQQSKGMMSAAIKSKSIEELIAQEASESITNIRTVTSLSRENTYISSYIEKNMVPHRTTLKGYYINGLLYGFSTCAQFLVFSLAFYSGSRFVMNENIDTTQMLDALYAILFAAFALGQTSSVMSMIPNALASAFKIRELFNTSPTIDIAADNLANRKCILPAELNGEIKVDSTSFSYPTRPDILALNNVNVNAAPGQTIALVGSSGSGKSTIINLILRLYDVLEGSVSVDSVDVRDWPLDKLRDHPSLVSQEPVLFDCSASENIKYGKPDATEFEVQQAAKAANIHNLLMDLPDGYNTRVGGKGSMLSGGQKQRIAIARALIRNPKILLLDEATSALDTESEKVVQYALDKASVGRTTISVAHRLSTIQNADWIYVFKSGEVIEQGNHESLIGLGGTYASLVKQQSLAN